MQAWSALCSLTQGEHDGNCEEAGRQGRNPCEESCACQDCRSNKSPCKGRCKEGRCTSKSTGSREEGSAFKEGSACKERCTGEKGSPRQARQPCRQGRTGPCASSPEVARCQSPCTQEPQPQGVIPFLNPTITLSASLGQCACTVCASPSCTRWIEKFNNARVLRACAC